MKLNKSALLLLALAASPGVFANTCSTSNGIDLSRSGGAFASLPPRDQGALGTCYAHSGSDLISSYLKIGRINIYQTAVANDTSMNGGNPDDVIDSFARLGWACTNINQFSALFPSVNKNIIGDLQDTFVGSPIFYTINANEPAGIARQKRIAEKAARIAENRGVGAGSIADFEEGLKNYKALEAQIKTLQREIKKLEDQKSWFRSNAEIDAKITKINKEIVQLKKRSKIEHARYVDGMTRLGRTRDLDALSEDEAAEVVYYQVNKQYLQFVGVMKNYGLGTVAPSLSTFIKDRVHYDSKLAYSYAGAMYPYKIIKQAMERACTNKTPIPSNIKGTGLIKKQHGTRAMQEKIESMLERNRQAVSVSFHSSYLTGKGGENHAVNIIGCRTNGRLTEYLLQNSWGTGCGHYKASLQSKCHGGRVWVPADSFLQSAYEINWVTRR